jgi:hypothetical protein
LGLNNLKFLIPSQYSISHTIFSVLYFNLPIALLLTYIFHAIVRKQLINHLPGFLYRRFCNYYDIEWKLIFYKRAPVDKTAVMTKTNYNFWLLAGAITLLILIIRVVFDVHLQAGDLAVSFIGAFLLSLILSSLYFTFK